MSPPQSGLRLRPSGGSLPSSMPLQILFLHLNNPIFYNVFHLDGRGDIRINSNGSSDISVYSEYLPYSSHILQDNTLDEDDDYTHVEDNDSTLT